MFWSVVMSKEQLITEAQQTPTYWFLVLETARETGDFQAAAEAQHRLRRLGVTVLYERPRRSQRKAAAHA